jgi:multicomponent Na+:H+ antiporter subunit D
MDHWLILPLLIPMLTAVLALMAFRSLRWQRGISLAGSLALLLAALGLLWTVHEQGIRALQVGNWPAPFGITLVADLLSAVMLTLAGLVALVTTIYSFASMDRRREALGYYPLFHFLLMGVCGAFLTGDLFNLYVWFEVMLMSSFVLLALGGERQQMEGAFKYVTLNLLSSALFLAAVGITYGLAGTLNMADLGRKFANPDSLQISGILTTVAMLFLVAFGIKAAIFPLFFWLPASYHTPPVAVSALFSGLLTKVGVYAIVRVFTLIFVHDTPYTHTLLLVLGGLTMVTGVLGAVAQTDVRRLLSFHIISQIGYLLMGLGLFAATSLAAVVYFVFHVSVAKTALFLVSGVVDRLQGTYDLKKLGGLYRARPLLAVLFLVPALSLAGLPPLSGFFAKLGLVVAGLQGGQGTIVAVALAVSLLTLFSMIKIWNEAFWKPQPDQQSPAPNVSAHLQISRAALWLVPIALLGLVNILMGFFANETFGLALTAGEQLVNPETYIQAVLGSLP